MQFMVIVSNQIVRHLSFWFWWPPQRFYQLGLYLYNICIWITDPSLCGPAANKLILFSYRYGLVV